MARAPVRQRALCAPVRARTARVCACALCTRSWNHLSTLEQSAATVLGYTKDAWDAELPSEAFDEPPPPPAAAQPPPAAPPARAAPPPQGGGSDWAEVPAKKKGGRAPAGSLGNIPFGAPPRAPTAAVSVPHFDAGMMFGCKDDT